MRNAMIWLLENLLMAPWVFVSTEVRDAFKADVTNEKYNEVYERGLLMPIFFAVVGLIAAGVTGMIPFIGGLFAFVFGLISIVAVGNGLLVLATVIYYEVTGKKTALKSDPDMYYDED